MVPRKILVTDADGFIGSHLTEALVRQGHLDREKVFLNEGGGFIFPLPTIETIKR